MIGAKNIDQCVKTAFQLIKVIGNIRGEIGPATVGFLHVAIDIIPKGGAAKQRLLARLPVFGGFAFGRL